jgi:hypothetical protein
MLSEHELLMLEVLLEYIYCGSLNQSTLNCACREAGIEYEYDSDIAINEDDFTDVLRKVIKDYKNHSARFER